MHKDNPGRPSGRDAYRRRETNERSLVVQTRAGFHHHLTLSTRSEAIAFAEWLTEQAGMVKSVQLLDLDGRDAERGWSGCTPAGERAPWMPPPSDHAPLRLEIRTDRSMGGVIDTSSDVPIGYLIRSEMILVTPDGREYGLKESHMLSDGMADGELRPDGARSIVRLEGRAYIVAYVPDPQPG